MPKLTQRQQLLSLLETRGDQGVELWEIISPAPKGMAIRQYNTRIFELNKGLKHEGKKIIRVDQWTFRIVKVEENAA